MASLIQGKNSIIKAMYSYKSLNDMKEFNKVFREFLDQKGNLLKSKLLNELLLIGKLPF